MPNSSYLNDVARKNGFEKYGDFLSANISKNVLDKQYTIPELINELKTTKKLSIKEIADAVGKNSTTIYRWRDGKRSPLEDEPIRIMVDLLKP